MTRGWYIQNPMYPKKKEKKKNVLYIRFEIDISKVNIRVYKPNENNEKKK